MSSVHVVLGLAAALDLEIEQLDRFSENDFVILLLYVDDMLVIEQNSARIKELKEQLGQSFTMKDLGPVNQILGIRIFHDRGDKKLWLSQETYIEKTRADIAYAVDLVSRFLSNPGMEHWSAEKWIFRYLHGTSKMYLQFGREKLQLVGRGGLLAVQVVEMHHSLNYGGRVHCRDRALQGNALDEKLSIGKVQSDENGSNMLTKVLPKGKLEACCDVAGLTNFTPTQS
ncbi:hypothetical protein Nepgr_023732 [Nepenthes gracilis]|uniref:Reverse transcriptase Ty1/copia-type domain-containing protein n=1 Tax=Nepenthes gracilis TaxID=150966 RepID=A0AAD3T3L3_NEPGR|nr:hypothetical protein Nepgr_023732 [Nepenthes gracilis]